MNRENISATIADLQNELTNIENTKRQIESSLQMLTQLMESPLMANRVTIDPIEKKSRRTKFPAQTTQPIEGGPVASNRVHSVLAGMNGRFLRSELYKNANNDGHGFIAPGTFANIFSKLIKRNQIACVEGTPGQRDSIYMKTDEIETETAPKTDSTALDLF